MKFMKSIFTQLLVFCFVLLPNAFADDVKESQCHEVRGALDVGSGTSKLLVARVNICLGKIEESLLDAKEAIAWNEDLDLSKDNKLSDQMLEKGTSALLKLVQKAKALNPVKIVGVATSVFRKASNGDEILNKLEARTGVKIHLLSQTSEAEMGYFAAVTQFTQTTTDKGDSILVWDIGGGSMQMFAKNNQNSEVYLGNLASVTLKNMYLEYNGLDGKASPNPLKENAQKILRLVRYYAKTHLPRFFLEDAKSFKIIGVGGVHSLSVQRLAANEKNSYDRNEVEQALLEYSKKSDVELKGDYKTTDVTNLALVAGFMDAMGINQIQTLKINLGQGVLFYPAYWAR
jgi:exopolyphosphatase/guanosine-5'-triphosphate,3'-diphosphate pyrophosphatase